MPTFNFKSKEIKRAEKLNKLRGVIRTGHSVPYGTFSIYGNDAAIYGIKSKTTGKQYIGATKHIQRRLMKHFNELKHNRHRAKIFQEDYNKYGFNDFEIIIYENTNEDLLIKEKNKQVEIGINNLYNEKISGVYITEERRQQIINQNRSTHKSKEYREKMSKLKTNRIRQYDLDFTPIKDWESCKEIVETLGYTRSVILSCCNGNKVRAYNCYWKYIDDNGNIVNNGYIKARKKEL